MSRSSANRKRPSIASSARAWTRSPLALTWRSSRTTDGNSSDPGGGWNSEAGAGCDVSRHARAGMEWRNTLYIARLFPLFGANDGCENRVAPGCQVSPAVVAPAYQQAAAQLPTGA